MKKCIIRHLVLSISILLTSCHKTVDKSVTPNALGDRFLQQKDYDEAIYSFEKTLAQNENDLHALVGLYYSYFYQQNWLACEDIINKASSLISNNDISSFEQEDLVAIQEGEKKISSILMNPISAEYTGGRIDYIYEYDEEGNVTYWNKKYSSGTRPLTVEFYEASQPESTPLPEPECIPRIE